LTPQHTLPQEEGPGEMVFIAHHSQLTAKLHQLHSQYNLRQKLTANMSNIVISTTADKKMVDNAKQKLKADVDQIEKELKRGLEKLNDKLANFLDRGCSNTMHCALKCGQ
jgi:hypothetical protein